jgi:hypothetical protein
MSAFGGKADIVRTDHFKIFVCLQRIRDAETQIIGSQQLDLDAGIPVHIRAAMPNQSNKTLKPWRKPVARTAVTP